MDLSKDKVDQLEEAAKPLIKWLNENGNPHTMTLVTVSSVELIQGLALIKNDEFVKD